MDGSVASVDIKPGDLDSAHLTLLLGTYGGEIIEVKGQVSAPSAGNKAKSSAVPASDSASNNSNVNLDLADATSQVRFICFARI